MRSLVLVLVVAIAACGCAARTPTPTPSTGPTPPPGAGRVTFGMAFSEDTLRITAPSESFPRGFAGTVWFVASLSEASGATSLTATLARRSGETETVVWTRPFPIGDAGSTSLADGRSLAELGALQPGTYVMRFARGATVLAEGRFEVA